MVHETIEGTFRQTNLTNESAEYLAKREELRLPEIELMRQRERVAELRPTTSPKTSTSRLSPQPIRRPCERTPASVAGTGCVC